MKSVEYRREGKREDNTREVTMIIKSKEKEDEEMIKGKYKRYIKKEDI